MTREEALNIAKLLSAMESWMFSVGKSMPDFLIEQLNEAQEVLRREILK